MAGASLENAPLADRLSQEATESEQESKPESGEGVETLQSEDEEMSARPKRQFFKRYRIQEVIKRGQIVLVQVIKEERGNKGASLTSYLSLAGRYCVLMPNSPKDGGVSRKISEADTRRRLKDVMAELKLAGSMSVIIRTAGIDRTRAEIRRDFDYLVKLWNHIREDTLAATAPALIYEEGDLIKRAIRDQYTNDIEEVWVEGDAGFKQARDFMKMLLPSHTPRVKQYRENMPLFYAYGIEDQLLSMHDPIVKLKSGGYIVLSPTEALISIDVNSGRATGERNIEETAAKTNLEAAVEVARQLRLRDLAGLIVIDFIDMFESRNRRAVERTLKDALKSDRAKIQLGRISPFGLLEMSRQRLRPSISETNMVPCPHCVGRGMMRSNESMSLQIVRALEKEAATGNWGVLKLNAPEHTAMHLLNHKRHLLAHIESRYDVQIVAAVDHGLAATVYQIEKTRRSHSRSHSAQDYENRRNRNQRARHEEITHEEPVEIAVEPVEEFAEIEEAGTEEVTTEGTREGEPRRRRRGRRGGRGRSGERRPRTEDAERLPEDAERPAEVAEQASAPEDGQVSNGQGRGNNRRRWRGRDEQGNRPERQDRPERAERQPRMERQPRSERQEQPGQEPNEARYVSEAASLPAFTRAAIETPARESYSPSAENSKVSYMPTTPAPQPSTTSRPEGTPPRRGWWQRIIELD